jgi:FtsP/CotA-like multicopper oxidase with cupredoxin domain
MEANPQLVVMVALCQANLSAMNPTRRDFLSIPLALSLQAQAPADLTLSIGNVEVEIAPKRTIRTIGYNGSFPGPVLRFDEGRSVTVDVVNDTASPELVHWHGLFTPCDADGSAEEGTPMVPARGRRRYTFAPRPSGTRWYHSHVYAGRKLERSTYSGQYGVLIVESRQNPARYDQEVPLAIHGWKPFLSSRAGADGDEGSLEVHYGAFTVNSHALGGGEPVRVRAGQRVLFRIVNANATMVHRLALPGHRFTVVALDGNRVPNPASVNVLEIAPGERIDAVVEMSQPGVTILGEVDDRVRKLGLGVLIEYAGRTGEPQWTNPPNELWDYTRFGRDESAGPEPEARFPLVFKQKWAGNRTVDHWTINGKEYPKTDPIRVRANRRYRLIFDNQSDDMHPVHLHRHSFELVNVAGKPVRGLMKDVVDVMARTKVEVDLVADNPGLSLFHCHMQLHMDFGFMTLLQYEGEAAPPSMSHGHA